MEEIKSMTWNGFNVASTFSGCGGSSLGYKMAGFKVLWASEFIPAAQETYEANQKGTILDKRDIREVHPEDILKATGLKVGQLDLLDGSPPCASFSTAGIREKGWGRVKKYSDSEQRTDDLFFEFVRIIKGVMPKCFVAENVKGLTIGTAKSVLGSMQKDMFAGETFIDKEGEEVLIRKEEDTIIHALMDCGYKVGFRVLNAADLGVPQSRNRVIFVGVRKDVATKFNLEPVWPKPLGYQYTVRDAIPWILKQADNGSFGKGAMRDADLFPSPTIVAQPNTGNGRFPPSLVEAESDISRFAIGKEWDNLKIGQKSAKYFSLIKIDPEIPCPTICASHGRGSIASVVHPVEKRKFTIQELKRICGFPDDFELTGSYAQQLERLGRAVPPVMMSYIAATVRDEILCKIKKS